jgi:hypothetical protein
MKKVKKNTKICQNLEKGVLGVENDRKYPRKDNKYLLKIEDWIFNYENKKSMQKIEEEFCPKRRKYFKSTERI